LEPVILHIETSSRLCSVALSTGLNPSAWQISDEINDHSVALAPMIRHVLASGSKEIRDLNAVAISIGPGSYTGLRVGLSTAKGICFGTGIPLLAISTLESLAWTALQSQSGSGDQYPDILCVAALDARRNDAYVGIFDNHAGRLADDQFLTVSPGCLDRLIPENQEFIICGEGMPKWESFAADMGVRCIPVECSAINLVPVAYKAFHKNNFADLSACVPRYLKAPNITTPR